METKGLQVVLFAVSATNMDQKQKAINDWLVQNPGCRIEDMTVLPAHAGSVLAVWYRPPEPPSETDADLEAILADEKSSIKQATRVLEERLIRRVLAQTNGNRMRAAEILEISHRALMYKIKEFGIR